MAGLAAQGPLPAGMLRIRLGSQERYVWPVHLPGWLGLGWRVGGQNSELAEAAPLTPAPIEDPAPVLEPEAPVEPPAAPTRVRRGRPRKEKVDTALAEPVADATPEAAPEAAVEVALSGDNSAATADPASQESSLPSGDPEPLLTALPDDLFDDPLI